MELYDLLQGIIWQESKADPYAVRYEPLFYENYIKGREKKLKGFFPRGVDTTTELTLRSTSFGLFQIMGQTAREYGFKGKYLTELCDPDINTKLAIDIFQNLLLKTRNDYIRALLRWNGGGDETYPSKVYAHVEQRNIADIPEMYKSLISYYLTTH